MPATASRAVPRTRAGLGPAFPFSRLTEAALAACTTAERDHPNTVRFAYQLGLALARVKRYPEAVVRLRETAEAGYARQTWPTP